MNDCYRPGPGARSGMYPARPPFPRQRLPGVTPGRLLLAFLLLACLDPAPALAQSGTTPGTRVIELPDPADDEPEIDEVRFTFGMQGSVSPTYSGSDETGYALAPAARIVWRGYSISTSSVSRASTEAGTRSAETGVTGPLYRRHEFAFGFGASINRGRDIGEEDRERGLKDLPGTLIGRMRMRYYINPDLVITATLVGDLLGRQGHLELPIGLGWRHSLRDGLLFQADVGMTFVNAKGMSNNYGIGPEEQAASGLPLYEPGAGLREVAGSVGLVGEPSEHWVWLARMSLVKLVGPAAASPIVKKTFQPALLVGFAYRFTLH